MSHLLFHLVPLIHHHKVLIIQCLVNHHGEANHCTSFTQVEP